MTCKKKWKMFPNEEEWKKSEKTAFLVWRQLEPECNY